MKPWDGIIPEQEQRAYRAVGFGRSTGIGRHPALLIIDVQYRTVGTVPQPFWEAIKEFPTACGRNAYAADVTARWRGVPVLEHERLSEGTPHSSNVVSLRPADAVSNRRYS